jgi:hypothetical protein
MSFLVCLLRNFNGFTLASDEQPADSHPPAEWSQLGLNAIWQENISRIRYACIIFDYRYPHLTRVNHVGTHANRAQVTRVSSSG